VLNRFFKRGLAREPKKYCNGLKGRPTRIDMPKEEEKMVAFQNCYKQMKAPYVIYADFEALFRTIPLCGLEDENKEKSYTVKTGKASGYSYTVVRSDGEVLEPEVYRGINAVGTFFSDILQEEVKIRDILAAPRPIVMAPKDWWKFTSATDCHICNKSLIKDEFLDSLPVWSIEEDSEGGEKRSYKSQGHKIVFTKHKMSNSKNGGLLG